MSIITQNPSEISRPTFLVVDPNQIILAATKQALEQNYPDVNIQTAVDAQSAGSQVEQSRPMLVLQDLVLPETPDFPASHKVGIQFVQSLMQADPRPHIVVSSTKVMSLSRIISPIKSYGGFAAGDKFTSIKELLRLVDYSFRGSIYLPPLLRHCPKLKPHLLEILRLKFEEEYSDQAICEEIWVKGRRGISDRTLRNYWPVIHNLLGVHYDSRKDPKIQIEIAARKLGLID